MDSHAAVTPAPFPKDQSLSAHLQGTPLHIAHILPWPGVGGTEHATLRVMRGVGEGFRHTAFCMPDATPVDAFFRGAGIETGRWCLADTELRHVRGLLYRARELARALRSRGVDLVHCADLRAAPVGALAGRLARRPVLCHVRNRYTAVRRPDRQWYWAVNRFAFVSQATWSDFGYRVPARRGIVVYDGISLPPVRDRARARALVRAEFGIPPEAPIIGMVARMEPQKDYETLAGAAARLRSLHPEARFLIVGGISGLEEYRRHFALVQEWLRTYGVRDRFIFTDYRADVEHLMLGMDVFVLSTHNEGLPLVILEAMAAGLPVVASDVDGVPEVIRHGATGLLAPPEDPDGLAAELGKLLGDASLRTALGEGARDAVARRFTVEGFSAAMRAVYMQMLRRRGTEGQAPLDSAPGGPAPGLSA